jgi:syntaxin 1B/2/3
MSVLVEQQDEMITQIEATTAEAEKDLEVGVQYTEKAVASAAGARKKRWICFVIIIVIVIILAIIIVVKVVLPAVNKPADKKETVTVTGSATPTGAVATSTAALAALVTGVASTFVERAVLVMPTQTALSPF